jgi:hypothetical protein
MVLGPVGNISWNREVPQFADPIGPSDVTYEISTPTSKLKDYLTQSPYGNLEPASYNSGDLCE